MYIGRFHVHNGIGFLALASETSVLLVVKWPSLHCSLRWRHRMSQKLCRWQSDDKEVSIPLRLKACLHGTFSCRVVSHPWKDKNLDQSYCYRLHLQMRPDPKSTVRVNTPLSTGKLIVFIIIKKVQKATFDFIFWKYFFYKSWKWPGICMHEQAVYVE
jgi:hypothetical protein